MAKNRETTTVQNPALLEVGARPDVLVWRQQSGLFRAYDDTEKIVRIGMPGLSDSMAVVAVTITPDMVGQTVGVAVAPEFKVAARPGRRAGTQSDAQAGFQRAFEQRGGVYRLVRSADDMRQLVADVQSGQALRALRRHGSPV
jgi:hypothetical protein